jgi:1-deoxy-D-xylulose-5-phosphate reductoisomerase
MPTNVERLNLAALARLDFEEPDYGRFPALRLAREALQAAGAAPAVLNAANEVAVELFLAKRIRFNDISMIVERVLERFSDHAAEDLEAVMELDGAARAAARTTMREMAQ